MLIKQLPKSIPFAGHYIRTMPQEFAPPPPQSKCNTRNIFDSEDLFDSDCLYKKILPGV